MAFPIPFDGQNGVLRAPVDEAGNPYPNQFDLPVHHNPGPPGLTWACFRLTEDEIREVNRTGVIWVGTFGHLAPPPMALWGKTPFLNTSGPGRAGFSDAQGFVAGPPIRPTEAQPSDIPPLAEDPTEDTP